MSKQIIPFNKPPFFQEEFARAVKTAADARIFSGDGLNTGQCINFFESKYGYKNSLLTPSCTASLEMAALALDLGPGDEVIVPSFTFVTSALAFALRGVTLIFADSEIESPNVSVSDILSKVTEKTKAIVVVHYAGVPVDVQRILEKTSSSIPIVEDCAHAIGSIDPKTGDYVGKAGCMSTFSFHETKNVGIGEGGLLVVNDEKLWLKAQVIREKGTNRTEFKRGHASFYTWIGLGSSYLMSDIDAAMLWSALQNIDKIQKRRLEIWDAYDRGLVINSLFKKPLRKFIRANAHMYYLEFRDPKVRGQFCKVMKDKGIAVTTHYVPLDISPYAKNNSSAKKQSCPRAMKWSKTLVRLPLFFDLAPGNVKEVINTVNAFTKENGFLLEPATEEHWEDIRLIRNKNSEFYKNAEQIEKDDHWKFMRKYHEGYKVGTENGKCVAFIGHVNKDFRVGSERKGSGVANFILEMWIENLGRSFDVSVLRSNKRVIAYAWKFGYAPGKEAWERGDNPVPLLRMSENETVDVLGLAAKRKPSRL